MATIWKYEIPHKAEFTVEMPKGAEILLVQTQFDEGRIWARVEPSDGMSARELEKRLFLLRGTGQQIDPFCKHVGSFILSGGREVFHLFEVAAS